MGEALFLTLLGIGCGVMLLYGLLLAGQPIIEHLFGIAIALGAPSAHEWTLLGMVLTAGFLAGCIPGCRAYRLSLADGLALRL